MSSLKSILIITALGVANAASAQAVQPTPAPARTMLPVEQTVKLRIQNLDASQEDILIFGVDADRMQLFAQGITAGKDFTVRAWAHLFTEVEFRDLRSQMIAAGWARWVNPNAPQSGALVSKKGMAILRGLTAPLAL